MYFRCRYTYIQIMTVITKLQLAGVPDQVRLSKRLR